MNNLSTYSDQTIQDHFGDATEMVSIGSGIEITGEVVECKIAI